MGSLSTFQQMWISKQEYDECGPSIVHRKCPTLFGVAVPLSRVDDLEPTFLLKVESRDKGRRRRFRKEPLHSDPKKIEFLRACFAGPVSTVAKALASPGFDPNSGYGEAMSGLAIASSFGHTKIVELLLKAPRVNASKRMNDGMTPFLVACQFDQLAVIKLFYYKKSAVLYELNPEGNTGLKYWQISRFSRQRSQDFLEEKFASSSKVSLSAAQSSSNGGGTQQPSLKISWNFLPFSSLLSKLELNPLSFSRKGTSYVCLRGMRGR